MRFFYLLVFFALTLAITRAQAQGVLTFDTLEHDFGAMAEGETPTHTFVFTNTGDQPVRLAAVRPSCGCTTPEYTTDPVAPGTQGEIVVAYNSQGRPGDFRKSIAVEAEGAEPRLTTLRITGMVTPATIQNGVTQGGVQFDTESYAIEAVAPESEIAHTFKMQNTSTRPLRIEEVRTFVDGVSVTAPTTRPIFAGEVVNIEVLIPRAATVARPDGTFDVAIVLATTDELQPSKSLRVRGSLAPRETTAGTQ
ncbi:MAG: DUF1573 domain-containing protein [Rhodothermaceae bacterium]|nr:DUF1573 domain-containing protein [Rhodothermaceae bacterium]